MTEIDREVLFGKLNPVAYQTLESATLFCKLRGNPYVELAHWVHQLLEHTESDVRRVVSAFDLDPARLASGLTRALERLPRGATSVRDLSPSIDALVERAWLTASLSFGATRVRSGHVLLAALRTPELARGLRGISAEMEKLEPAALARRFDGLLGGAPEARLDGDATASLGDARDDARGPAPAALGKREALARYAIDLTARARAGDIDPIVGRDAELRQVIDILMRRRQNNPILTGEAGVGKTAVVEALALRIAAGDVPAPLRDVALFALDVGQLAAGASMKGEFEQRLRQVIEEVEVSPTPVVLFVDEAHTLVGAGGAAGTGDAANLLKPALARGRLRTIAATTWAEYKRHIEKDPALTRRFQVVQVGEPEEDVALCMIRGSAGALEAHHRVQILDDALDAAVRLSHRYIPARKLPDKAVSLLDTACARVAVSQQAVPAAVEDARRTLEALDVELDAIAREAVIGIDDDARRVRVRARRDDEVVRLAALEQRWAAEKILVDRVLAIHARLRTLAAAEPDAPAERDALLAEQTSLQTELTQLQGERPLVLPTVDRQAISEVVSDWTGVPVGRMLRDELRTVLALADTLAMRVKGQDEALATIARRVQMSRAGLEDPRKPIGVFLLAGPSGVGKTETALALAETLYGGEGSLITINMSEFQEPHTVSTLKGAPPGYVGYGEGGVLTEAVRRRPYSVVLLDEVEKAHPDVHELFFQVFDKGSMEDGEGRAIDFRNTLILLTTNVGSEHLMHACLGRETAPRADTLAEMLRDPLREVFPDALLGRMVTVPYRPLSDATLRDIVSLQLARIAARIEARHGAALEHAPEVVDALLARCTERESGARNVEAILASTLLPRLSHELLTRLLRGEPARAVAVRLRDGELTCRFT
ncbi:MAG: type VI secretion system ATPase TssH [Polyangiales bacterium]